MNIKTRLSKVFGRSKPYVTDGSNYDNQPIPYLGSYIEPIGITHHSWDEYFRDEINVKHPMNTDFSGYRGISDVSLFNNLFGIPRPSFDLMTCDIIGSNPYYILPETIVCNYLRSVEFDVTDKSGERVDYAYDKMMNPNPQQSFWDVFIPMVRDLLRYDQGVIYKEFTLGGYLNNFYSLRGPEFWAETDRLMFTDVTNPIGNGGGAYFSHGFVTRWWQHTSTGLFIPFTPDEISMFKLYPNAGGIYGTDIMKHFRFHFKGLMSGTIVFGKIMDNGLVTNLIFKHPDIGSRETLQKRLGGVKNENVGPSNYGKTLHLIGNEDVQTVSNTLMDMQYIEAQKFGIAVIANLFGIPASEFSLDRGGESRSTSYRDRDIRNTRMLATLLTLIEGVINREFIPHLRGYVKGWTFSFKKLTNLDDELKQAAVTQQNMSSLMMAMQMGFPADIGMKLTQFGKQLTSEERDRVMELTQLMNPMLNQTQMDSSHGRYDGDDYDSTFMGYKEVDVTNNAINEAKSVRSGDY